MSCASESIEPARRKSVFLPLVVLLLTSACGSDEASNPGGDQPFAFGAADEASLMTTVRSLTARGMNGRRTGTDGAQQAATLIVAALGNCPGVEPVTGQSFRIEASSDSLPAAWSTPVVNIAARWPGSGELADEVILVSAHYDHLGPTADGTSYYPGAVDNAGGVAALLSLACSVPTGSGGDAPRRSIVFTFFDAEEAGLIGSKAWVGDPPFPLDAISTQLNLDGYGAPLFEHMGDGLVFGPDLSADLAEEISSVNESHGAYRMMPVGHEVLEGRSDQAPFQQVGIVAVHLATGIPPGVYHTPADTADGLDPAVLSAATDWTGMLALRMALRVTRPALIDPPRAPYATVETYDAIIGNLENYPEDLLGPTPTPEDQEALASALFVARAILDSWLDKVPETDEEWESFTETMAVVAAPFAALLL